MPAIFHALSFIVGAELSKPLSGWTLIRLAAGHSLEISYAVWACLCWAVIFGELNMEAQT